VVEPFDSDCETNDNTSADSTVYAESLVIDGTECITLGHGIQGDPVASHAFLGTSLVIDALWACRGWAEGQVSLRPDDFKREEGSSLIHAIKQSCLV
jgi:hypothetical protein